jgi:PAS domain S-box-containing protein
MELLTQERKAIADLCIAMVVSLLFAALNVALTFNEVIYHFFADRLTATLSSLIVNVLFFWLAFMLWVAFFRWRKESHNRQELENVLSSISPDALIVINPNRQIEICNESVTRIFGYKESEVLHKQTDLLYFDRRVDKTRKGEIRDALERNGFHIGTAKGRRKDGTTFPLEIITGHLSGRTGAVLLLRDISYRVKAEEERLELERRVQERERLESLGALAGGIAHDVNNLLMGIMGNSELALAELEDDNSQVERYTRGIKSAADRAADLCKHLLWYSGRCGFVKQAVDISRIINDAQDSLKQEGGGDLNLELRLASGLPAVELDPDQLSHVLTNLVKNASDACDGDTNHVVISTGLREFDTEELQMCHLAENAIPGDYVFVEVADDGKGMDRGNISRIFDPFYSTKVTGRGLGLADVLGILKGHGGFVKVESEMGKGSTFTLLFPGSSEPIMSSEEICETSDTVFSGIALLVDDEEVVRSVCGDMLALLGFDVLTAESGDEAIAIFKDKKDEISVVLLDMTMPGMSGEETLRHMQAMHEDVVIVFSSGYNKDAAVFRDAEQGPSGFIQKPYELDVLRQKMSDVLSLRRSPDSGVQS